MAKYGNIDIDLFPTQGVTKGDNSIETSSETVIATTPNDATTHYLISLQGDLWFSFDGVDAEADNGHEFAAGNYIWSKVMARSAKAIAESQETAVFWQEMTS